MIVKTCRRAEGARVPRVLVVTRLRAPSPDIAAGQELRAGLDRSLAILAEKPGFLGGEVARNIDDPDLWVLCTRWRNVGSYRRAIGSYESKMHIQPLMAHAVDEPSAYEVLRPGEQSNEAVPRVTE